MRIGKSDRVSPKNAKRAGRTGSGSAVFQPAGRAAAARSASKLSTAAILPMTGIDAVLALQSVNPGADQQKMISRGHALLNLLDELKLELLSGQITPGRTGKLAQTIAEQRTQLDDPQLSDILEQVELRARVELAKHARYPV